MATATQSTSEYDLNQLNLAMRQSPWYQQWFEARGISPNNVKLTEEQRADLTAVAAQNGYQLGDRMKIDPAGNINQKGGFAGMPTWAKIAIAAAPIAATAGLGAIGAGPLAGFGAGGGGTAAGTGAAASGAGAGTLATVAGAAGTGLSTMDKIGSLLRTGGNVVGAATNAAAQRQYADAQLDANANAQNIQGENAFQNQQQSMAELEAKQQDLARRNLYRASVAKNPQTSVENPRGGPAFSPEMLEGMTNLEKQALSRLAEESQYTTGKMRKPRDYTPYAPNTTPSTMQKVGNWLAPGLSIANLALEDLF